MDKILDSIEENDFGFSFIDTVENENPDQNKRIDQLEQKVHDLYNAILPFLDNLCKNPESTTIKWPDRVEKIQAFKQKLKTIVEEK